MVFRLHGSSASFARMVQLREANFLTGQGIPEPVPTTNNPVLEAREITKSFGGIRALKGVSLQLLPGEVHALVGENGAGKSTLIKVLTGAVQPDSGEIWLRGERVENTTPALTRALGISVVYQEPALFPDLTVAENLALGKETRRPWHRVAWKARTNQQRHCCGGLEHAFSRTSLRANSACRSSNWSRSQRLWTPIHRC